MRKISSKMMQVLQMFTKKINNFLNTKMMRDNNYLRNASFLKVDSFNKNLKK